MNFKKFRGNKSYNIILISVLVILVFFLLFNLLINPILNGIVKPNILSKINSSEDINVKIEDLSYSLFTNTIGLNQVEVKQTDGEDTLRLNIRSVRAGVNWVHLIFNEGYRFSKVAVEEPLIQQFTSAVEDEKESNSNSNIFDLIDSLRNKLHFISAEVVEVDSGNYYNKNGASGLTDSIKNFSFRIDDLLFDSTSTEGLKLKAAGEINLRIEKAIFFFEDQGYMLAFKDFHVNTAAQNIIAKNFSFKPYLTDDHFFSRQQYRIDRFILNAEHIEMTNINFRELSNNEILIAQNFILQNFEFEALTNMRMQEDPAAPPPIMPNEALSELPFLLNINKAELKEGTIRVKELYPYDEQPAELLFADLYTTLVNIKNNETANVDVVTKLTGSGRLNVHFDLRLTPGKLDLKYSGRLDSMNAADLNKFITIADRVKITSGNIHHVDFNVVVKGDSAAAQSTPVYSDLSIVELSEDTGSSSGLKEKVTSFIANTFVIKKSNPGDDAEIEKSGITYLRHEKDAFFEYIWIALRKALGEVIGFD